jgi:hypothetical protein
MKTIKVIDLEELEDKLGTEPYNDIISDEICNLASEIGTFNIKNPQPAYKEDDEQPYDDWLEKRAVIEGKYEKAILDKIKKYLIENDL